MWTPKGLLLLCLVGLHCVYTGIERQMWTPTLTLGDDCIVGGFINSPCVL